MTETIKKRAGGRGGRRQALGRYGEGLAARRLEESGLVLLDRNWRCPDGELDLVAREGDTVVICEVKTRSSVTAGTPHEAVTPDKLARLRRLGARWVREHAATPRGVRIDLVAVSVPRRGAPVVDHVRGLT